MPGYCFKVKTRYSVQMSLKESLKFVVGKFGYSINKTSSYQNLFEVPSKIHKSLIVQGGGVLHIGGHLAEERFIYQELEVPVLWIEGIPQYANEIKKLISQIPSQQVECYLLSDISKTNVKFYLANNDRSSSSLYQLADNNGFKDLSMDQEIYLDTFRFDEVHSLNEVSSFHHLVLDVQGAELKVLHGLGLRLDLIVSIKLEVSTFQVYEGAPLYEEVRNFLTDKGFFPLWEPGKNYHGDLLFIRNL